MGTLTGIIIFFLIMAGLGAVTGQSDDRNVAEAGQATAFLCVFFAVFFSTLLVFAHFLG